MSKYDDLTQRLLERRAQYVAAQKKRNKMLTGAAATLCVVALVGVAVWQGADAPSPPPVTMGTTTTTTTTPAKTEDTTATTTATPTETEDTTTATTTGTHDTIGSSVDTSAADGLGDLIGMLVIDGVTYVQCAADEDAYTPDVYLGAAHDYEGTYQRSKDVVGRVYTVKEDPHVLIVELSNGGTVVLVAENP